MAIGSDIDWIVRDDGSDLNGGGATRATGYGLTNVASASVNSTTGECLTASSELTDPSAPFVAGHLNHILRINVNASGLTGDFKITQVQTSSKVTLDRTPTTVSDCTGIQYRIGGARATPGHATASLATGNDMHIRAGTYVLSSTANVSGGRISTSVQCRIMGFITTPGDILEPTSSAPVLKCGANSVVAVTFGTNGSYCHGLVVDGDKATRTGTKSIACSGQTVVKDCIIQNCAGNALNATGSPVVRCILQSNAAVGIEAFASVSDTAISGGTYGIAATNLGAITNCLIVGATTAGIQYNNTVPIRNCTIANCGTGIIYGANNPFADISNCVIYGYTNYGIDVNALTTGRAVARNNAIGGGGTANTRGGNLVEVGTINLASNNPFVNSGSGDYRINPASTGGALCKSTGASITFGSNVVPGIYDLGAMQIPPAAGGVSSARIANGI